MRSDLLYVLAAAVTIACASTARVTGDFAEYRSYREARLATTLEARLGASERFLRDYPDGNYSGEVQHWFVPAERRYFRLSWNNLPRLRAYLDALPKGPHAAAAAERIDELESRTRFAARREERATARARAFELGLAQAAEQRRAFLTEITRLTHLFASVHGFGRPIAALDPELLRVFGLRLLPAECTVDRCTNVRTLTFAVPENKQLSTRTIDLVLELELVRGTVQQLSFSAPELLSRVAEAVLVRASPTASPQERAEALGSALEVLSAALDTALPEERCAGNAVSPVVLLRQCAGTRLEVAVGTEPGAADRLRVSPGKH